MNFTVSNTGDLPITDWKLTIKSTNVKIDSIWNADANTLKKGVSIIPASWSKTINKKGSISFGFLGKGTMPKTLKYTLVYEVNGVKYSVSGVCSTPLQKENVSTWVQTCVAAMLTKQIKQYFIFPKRS
ncbi:Cellulose binding domain-containing protein [Anaeromicropila populeti]|uniref:Cellulose binding domain-containing protein n=2 Tax=Anaeromicropila populeti TaxID=37658 RepID=A0A1I6JRN6_9FIRM|nr:Cellulose binding domain-containing protein [Anaeromicropila populeti]